MSTTQKLAAGGAVPAIAVPKVGGGEIAIGNAGDQGPFGFDPDSWEAAIEGEIGA
jgi:hypothetical protein